jgi:hypothetical protein
MGLGRHPQIGSCISKALPPQQTWGQLCWANNMAEGDTLIFSLQWRCGFLVTTDARRWGTHSVRQLLQNEWLFEQNYGLALMIDRETTCVIWTKIQCQSLLWHRYGPSSLSVLVVRSLQSVMLLQISIMIYWVCYIVYQEQLSARKTMIV